ncbi:MAG: phage baseplate assembly protein V [Acetobacter fabarum]|nr:phage baseplate assembly protein V [Acetobacter fabarum]MCI1909307.1 phage baseplate assembly protein V [Acetobacter fabarum]MCI1927285.1 phage baseplate assembly protein V [Acetobacter fabarum]MCI1947285.1 phage baseplate assembly protein V [Acetobacter fabarum]MCI2024002.1 phage baseplate assembly protein V [Acetobacter fabarum]
MSAVDPVNHAVKVVTQPSGIESGWLPYAALQVGSLRISCPPDVGAHVVLQHIDGDAEHGVVACPIYDAVVMPPLSPATGKVAQPGELLIVAGNGAPPQSAGSAQGAATVDAPWWHMTKSAIYSGVGQATETLTQAGKAWTVGDVSMDLTTSGLSVTGGSISTDKDVTAKGTVTGETDTVAAGISGKGHEHSVTAAPGTTGKPQ